MCVLIEFQYFTFAISIKLSLTLFTLIYLSLYKLQQYLIYIDLHSIYRVYSNQQSGLFHCCIHSAFQYGQESILLSLLEFPESYLFRQVLFGQYTVSIIQKIFYFTFIELKAVLEKIIILCAPDNLISLRRRERKRFYSAVSCLQFSYWMQSAFRLTSYLVALI